jgi:hypothetical protein
MFGMSKPQQPVKGRKEKPKAQAATVADAARAPAARVKVTIEVTTDQKQKLDRLGGAAWLRERIEEAEES